MYSRRNVSSIHAKAYAYKEKNMLLQIGNSVTVEALPRTGKPVGFLAHDRMSVTSLCNHELLAHDKISVASLCNHDLFGSRQNVGREPMQS